MKLCAAAVVQNIVTTLADYGVPEDSILGIRYGLRGFYDRSTKPVCLSQALVDDIHLRGGTILVHPHGSRMSLIYRLECLQVPLQAEPRESVGVAGLGTPATKLYLFSVRAAWDEPAHLLHGTARP